MNARLRQKAIDLRKYKELSYSEIRKRLGVPKSTLSYWLAGFPLDEKRILELRRNGWEKGEASRERFRATMRAKKEKKAQIVLNAKIAELKIISPQARFVAGLMLYLGEGDKKNNSRIGLSNTDPWVHKFFIKWLQEFLEVPKEKMRAELHLYENMDIAKEKKFWKNELGLGQNQFYKTQIRRLGKASFSYSESFRHGTCSLYVSGVEKKMNLMMSIQAFLRVYNKAL